MSNLSIWFLNETKNDLFNEVILDRLLIVKLEVKRFAEIRDMVPF